MDSRTDERPGPVLVTLTVLVSAVLFYFGTGFTPVPGLALLAALPPLLLAPRVGAWTTAWTSWLAFALGTINSWGLYRDSRDVPLPFAVVIVISTAAGFMAAVLLFRALLLRGQVVLAALAAPAVWVTVWYLAALLSPAGIMGTLATAQADVTVMLQIAALTGSWGVDFLALLVPATVAALLTPGVRALRVGVLTAVLVVLTVGYGVARLAGSEEDTKYRVALLAQNEPQWGTDVSTPVGQERIAAYGEQISRIPGGADIAVLPEGGFKADDESLPRLVEPLSEVASAAGTDIVVGLVMKTGGKQYIAALTIPADGGQQVRYDKWHDQSPKNTPGDDLAYLPGTRVGLSICADVNFTSPMRDYGREGADLITLSGADEDLNGWQHSRTALLRGVENGYGIAWSAQRGTLLVADAWGHAIAEDNTGGESTHASVVANLPAGSGTTLYAVLGDWFAWLCAVLVVAGLVVVWSRRTSQVALSGLR